ncbi:Endonuclease/exonuclease/phosphatase [Cinara cedri]|uniref:Endonuclease/exonuclease/phosphatase n=1 Tax=Cinara cedri TaxID=506608 RepID=A0A5E4NTQ7_9HEMI|nr:Endonuclease/exonuclease/phosphatase [Cinara cedri]
MVRRITPCRKKTYVQEPNKRPRISGAKENKNGNWKSEISLGTWNVGTLYSTGAAHTVTQEIGRYKLKIVAIQEIRWQGGGSLDINNYTIFYWDCDDRRQFSTGFVVHKSIVPNVMEFKTFNPRISLLTIKTYWCNLTIISVHAPTEEKTQEEKDDFYDELTNVVDGIPNNRIVVILGDLNAKVGKELIFKPTISHRSLHEVTNNNGLNLIDFATSKGLVIKSTMFSNKKIHKGTLKSPDGNHTNQIDHVLVNDRFKNSITDVKTMRGADCDSDHYLVKVNIKARLKCNNKSFYGKSLAQYKTVSVNMLHNHHRTYHSFFDVHTEIRIFRPGCIDGVLLKERLSNFTFCSGSKETAKHACNTAASSKRIYVVVGLTNVFERRGAEKERSAVHDETGVVNMILIDFITSGNKHCKYTTLVSKNQLR